MAKRGYDRHLSARGKLAAVPAETTDDQAFRLAIVGGRDRRRSGDLPLYTRMVPEDLAPPSAGAPERIRKFVFRLPPKSSAVVAPDGRCGGARIAMWELWLDLAERHASFAVECQLPRPDLVGSDNPEDLTRGGSGEIEHSMLAIAAAAFAIDGIYGSVRPFVQVQPSRSARPRQILETLKRGFNIGKIANRWMVDLDWLFDIRDRIVHHSDHYQPLRVVHETDEVLVAVPRGLHELGSSSATRAAQLAREVLETCRSSPKAATVQWVRGKANWEPGPGEVLYPGDLERRLFPLDRD